jgi:hypothetical protein
MTAARLAICMLLGCSNRDSQGEAGSAAPVASRALADATMTLPPGWMSSYDRTTDTWQITGAATVRIERADDRYVASPDAFMHHVSSRWQGRLVTIEARQAVGSGFAVTLAVFTGQSDPHPMRSTYVVKQLTRVWYQCYAEGVDDEAVRAQVIALCRSVRR